MGGTPDWQAERVRQYYRETTAGYLSGWSGNALGLHLGLADEHTQSNTESIENTNRFLAERACIAAGCRVLDAGCGVGGSALWLARTLRASVVGVSLVKEQIDLANEFALEQKLTDLVRFECCDMLVTGLAPASFDVVWNIESMCHVVEVSRYLAHALELLRPGGCFVCIDPCRTDRRVQEIERQVEAGWALAPMREPREITNAMTQVGFADVEHVDLTERAMPSAQAMRAMASKTLLVMRAEKEFAGKEDPIYEAHVRAALAMVDGMEAGATKVAHFRGIKPA